MDREIDVGIKDRFDAERHRRPWLDHLVRAGGRFNEDNGNHLAAGITYFTILALFPLLLLAVSIAGFVLSGHPRQFRELQDKVTTSAPSAFRDTLTHAVSSAVDNRAGILSVGLVGALYTGLGWVGNVRSAVQALWGQEKPKENFVATKARDLLALLGLGIALIVSLGLTTVGTSATRLIMRSTGLDDVPGAGVATRVIGILIAIGADVLIFAWMLARLPHQRIAIRPVLRGAVFAAIGFEVLKVVGTYYIPRIVHSPAVAALGIVLALLVWINLVARFLLFVTSWTATATATATASIAAAAADSADAKPVGSKEEPPIEHTGGRQSPNGAAIAVGIFGAGAAAGAALAATARRSRRRFRRS